MNEGGVLTDEAVNEVANEVAAGFDTGAETGGTDAAQNDGFGGEGKLDPASPDAHRGEIVSVQHFIAGTGSQALQITLKSNDTGISGGPGFTINLWGPADVFDPNAPCWTGGHFDNTQLSTDSPGTNDAGKPKQSPAQAYARNFFNSKKTGTVQTALMAAAEQGRTGASLGLNSPTTPEEYVANLNAILAGTEVLIIRKPEKNADPKFDGALKVSVLYPISVLNDTKRLDGATKNVRRMFE